MALGMLLAQQTVLAKLSEVAQKIHKDSVGNEASFDCMPDNLDQIHSSAEFVLGKQSEPLLGSFMCRRDADCKVLLSALRRCPCRDLTPAVRTGNQSCPNIWASSTHTLGGSIKIPGSISCSSSPVEDATRFVTIISTCVWTSTR
jgi:hypothetical protein